MSCAEPARGQWQAQHMTEILVLSQGYPDGSVARVRAAYMPPHHALPAPQLMTTLRYERNGTIACEAGFAAPPLPVNSALTQWIGQSSDAPAFVMVRARRDVTSVVAVLSSGRRIALTLSEVVDQFGV